MAFDKEWREDVPDGDVNTMDEIDDYMRYNQYAVRERLAVDHDFRDDETGAEDTIVPTGSIGYHKKVTCAVRSADESAVAGAFVLYSKDISAKAELHGVDEDGNVIIITNAGQLAVLGSEGFRTGDLLMSSAAAPTGWTDVSATYNGRYVRVSSGTALETGGNATHTHGVGSYASQNHTHTVPATDTDWGSVSENYGRLGVAAPEGTRAATNNKSVSSSGAAAITGTSASANNDPLYVDVKMYSKI